MNPCRCAGAGRTWSASRRRRCATGTNTILARIDSRDAQTFFPSVQFGSEAALRADFDRRYVAEYSSAQFSALAGAVVAAFMLAIWWFRRSDLLYLLFGLTCLFWALRTQTYLSRNDSLGLVVALARPLLRLDRRLRAVGRGVLPALRRQARAALAAPARRLCTDRAASAGRLERRAAVSRRALLDRRPVRAGSLRALGVLPVAAAASRAWKDSRWPAER